MKLRPLEDRVVLKQSEAEEKTSGGIILPDTAKEKPQQGQVMAVGPGKILYNGKQQAPKVNKGDKVIYSKYAGSDFDIDGEHYVILREDDILGIIEK